MDRFNIGKPHEFTESSARARLDRFLIYWKALERAPGTLMPHVRTLLDHVEPQLQPSLALVDVEPPAALAVRLFGTQREAAFGKNITRANALDFYPEPLRASVFAHALCVVRHPVGWLTQRVLTSTRGTTVRFLSLSLPLAVDSGAAPCIVNFGTAIDRQPEEEFPARINALAGEEWVDLAAGIPDLPAGL
jgi:hypothetical protein